MPRAASPRASSSRRDDSRAARVDSKRPMSVARLFRHRPVTLLWSGLAVSAIGDELFAVAVAWVAVSLAGSQASWLGALRGAAALAGALLGGIWAERWDHRRTMLGADLARAALALLPVAALALGLRSLWLLAVPVALIMVMNSLFDPALRASLPRLLPAPDQLQTANALFDSIVRIARVAGPTLAATLTLLIPIRHLFTLDALTFLISAWAIAQLGTALPRLAHPPVGRRAALTAGWRLLAGQRRLQALYVCAMLGNVAWSVGISNGLALAISRHGVTGFGAHGLSAYGLALGAYGVGNVIAVLVIAHVRIGNHHGGFALGSAINGLGISLAGLAFACLPPHGVLVGVMASTALAALGGPLIDIAFILLLQSRFSPQQVASLARLRFAALGASILIGGASGAFLYARFETAEVILCAGLLEIVAGLAVLCVPEFAARGAAEARAETGD
ncbi:MFS transporter [Burkholderia plantarii]|uniref:MFS transporter n=1 Tax=Burkholderia plantarii TaxID=41899 RepID=UPI0009EAA7BE|nr:MFS transporter [Burkholderia plantarii]